MTTFQKSVIFLISISLFLAFASTLFWSSQDYYTDYGKIELAAPLLTSEEYG